MAEYRVKNWRKFQRYKNRRPPWIKLHRTIFDDRKFMSLPLACRGLLTQLWIIATEEDGKIIQDHSDLAWRLRIRESEFEKILICLLDAGFIIPTNSDKTKNAHACTRLHTDAPPEGETEGEGETEKTLSEPDGSDDADLHKYDPPDVENTYGLTQKQFQLFDRFYRAYPRRVHKRRAAKAWKTIKPRPDEELLSRMLASIRAMKSVPNWSRENMQFVPHPATWLNAGAWEDELPEAKEQKPKVCPVCNKIVTSGIESANVKYHSDCYMKR